MAEKRTRRRFTAEFKTQAAKRVLDGGKGLSEVATELGVSTGQLSTWRTEHLPAGAAEALAARKTEEAEMLRLKRETKRLEEENLILKKAAAFFEGDRVTARFACLRVGRTCEPRRRDAVPSGRRQRERLLRLAARDPRPPRPRRGGGRAARPHRPGLRRPTPGLRLAPGARRAAPGGAVALAPARGATDARDGPLRLPGLQASTPDHRQPPRPAGRPQPAGAPLRGREAGSGVAGRHQLPSNRRGLAVSGRDQGHGHARGAGLVHGRPPPRRVVRRRARHGDPAPWPTAARPDPT